MYNNCPSHWPFGLRFGSAAVHVLGLRVWIPLGAQMSLSCRYYVCCQVQVPALGWSLAQRSPSVCGVSECGVSERDRVASIIGRPWPTRGCCALGGGINNRTITNLRSSQETKCFSVKYAVTFHRKTSSWHNHEAQQDNLNLNVMPSKTNQKPYDTYFCNWWSLPHRFELLGFQFIDVSISD